MRTRHTNAACGTAPCGALLLHLLPLLPAKQRVTQPTDWMSTDAEVACPDPHCPTRFRITRLGKRLFKHSDTTAVPLPPGL